MQPDFAYLIPSSMICVILLACIVLYYCKWRMQTTKIMHILCLLLINQLLESIFEMMSFLGVESPVLCNCSIIGKTCFMVASSFWIIFITRLIYRQQLAPGKYLNIVSIVGKNILLTYVPSLIITVFLLVMVLISDTNSEKRCWRIVVDKTQLDYVIYLTCFIVPNLVAMSIVMVYLVQFWRHGGRSSVYLLFPLLSIMFTLYYCSIKLYMFFIGEQRMGFLEIPFTAESLLDALVFVYLYHNNKTERQCSSDMTLRADSERASSFLDTI